MTKEQKLAVFSALLDGKPCQLSYPNDRWRDELPRVIAAALVCDDVEVRVRLEPSEPRWCWLKWIDGLPHSSLPGHFAAGVDPAVYGWKRVNFDSLP